MVFSRYRITSEIARGGFAVVYSALDEWGKRTVAIKILNLSAQTDEAAKRRFALECEMLLKFSHNNIVRVMDSQALAGNHVLIMEYCSSTIQTEINQMHRLSVERTIEIGISMCNALKVLHENGVFHRDIKPSNILISCDGVLRLSDLGVARLSIPMKSTGTLAESNAPRTMSPLTSEGIQPGTLIYMAPEQLLGKQANAMSDIYSLGATLYECLAGHHYLGSIDFKDYQQIVAGIMKRKPPSLRRVNSSVPRYLDKVILRALEKDPDRRFEGDASHMCNALFHPEKGEGLVCRMLTLLRYSRGLIARSKTGFRCIAGHKRLTFGCPECQKLAFQKDSDKNRNQEKQENGRTTREPAGMRIFYCGNCYKSLIWVPTMAGRQVHCYHCGSEVTMPM
jgi:serine/threonine protein kinase